MNYIAYYRVSTQKQQTSHLGLEAQQSAVLNYCKQITAEFTDIESGKRSDNRPELQKALDLCKQTGATLVIAKLDRLSRNLVFIGQLMEAKVKFKCCDMPEADSFTIHIFAALAQKEREMISQRTKAALKALKDKGVKLGNPNLAKPEYTTSHTKMMRSARPTKTISPAIQVLISQMNDKPLHQIADALNKSQITTPKGSLFTPTHIHRLKKQIQNSV